MFLVINNKNLTYVHDLKNTCPMESASSLIIGKSSFLRLILFSSYSVFILRLFVKGILFIFIVIPLAKSNALSVRDNALPGSNSDDRSLSRKKSKNK